MDREKIGLCARACQLGRHRPSRQLNAFVWLLRLLRRGLILGWLRSWPLFRPTAGWLILLGGSGLFYLLSLLLSACERLLRNRWMSALRRQCPRTITACVIDFSWRDVWLAVRIAVFYRFHLLGRGLLLLAAPTLLTGAAVWLVCDAGVVRSVFYGGAVCLLLLWCAALFFLLTAWEPLHTAVSLLTDPAGFAQRKSSLARLDKDCFRLMRFSFLWLPLSGAARFQAKAFFAQADSD